MPIYTAEQYAKLVGKIIYARGYIKLAIYALENEPNKSPVMEFELMGLKAAEAELDKDIEF